MSVLTNIIYPIFMMFGGVAVLIMGMKMLSEGLEKSAGAKMRNVLAKVTSNRFAGVGIGAGVTAIIQSSAATTVMAVGFVNIGYMTLQQATAVIMGANIGTTVTAQLASLDGVINITAIASMIAFIGIIMTFISKYDNLKKIGEILLGLGVLFIGLYCIKESMGGLQENYEAEIRKLFGLKNPLLLILVGIVITALLQSSSVASVLVITFCGQGWITPVNGCFIILGSNIGTCVTAILASFGTNLNAKRTAIIHLLFNVIGCLIVFFPLYFFGEEIMGFMERISGSSIERQVANFHTLFNIIVTAVLLGFINVLVFLSKKIIPGEEKVEQDGKSLQFLDERILDTPSIAVSHTLKEVERMAYIAYNNYKKSMELLIKGIKKEDSEEVENISRTEESVNFLSETITEYLVKVSSLKITENDEKIVGSLYHVVSDLERIGDHAENILTHAKNMKKNKQTFSKDAKAEISDAIEKLEALFKYTMNAFTNRDRRVFEKVAIKEDEIDEVKRNMSVMHIERLKKGSCTPENGAVYLSVASNIERVADHMTNVAYSIRSYAK